MTLMTTDELKKLILPSSLIKAEFYTETPGFRPKHAGYNLYDLIGQIIETHSGSIAHSTLIDNMNGTYTFISGANPNVLIDTRAPSNPITVIGITPSGVTNEQQAIDYLFKYSQDAMDLYGVSWIPTPYSPSAVVTLGTFTGWTISDFSSIKNALQQLETSTQDSIHNANNGLTRIAGTGVGALQTNVQLGGTLIQNTTINASSFNVTMSSVNAYSLQTISCQLVANSVFNLKTPAVVATTATTGQYLKLLNATTGACDWADIQNINPVYATTSPTAALNKDLILADGTAIPLEITLPKFPNAGDTIIIKKVDNVNSITITPDVLHTIDYSGGIILTIQNETITLVFDGISTWIIISKYL